MTTTQSISCYLFQHTAARRRLEKSTIEWLGSQRVSTHSRPKAAGQSTSITQPFYKVSTHSRPKAAGHTLKNSYLITRVSTHSRPKAAGSARMAVLLVQISFNTQPPEGGWTSIFVLCIFAYMFQHTAARRRLACHVANVAEGKKFQHTAARRRLESG